MLYYSYLIKIYDPRVAIQGESYEDSLIIILVVDYAVSHS
ncbi:MAG: hypothetical protein ACJAUT_000221 [Cellvibrionaceae bacterium]|jgi:hypothetical protein